MNRRQFGATLVTVLGGEAATSHAAKPFPDPPASLKGLKWLPSGVAVPNIPFSVGQGKQQNFSDLRGTFIVLNLWATWCAPCVAEMASLDALAKALSSSGVAVLALNQDSGGMPMATQFLKQRGVENLTVRHDPNGRLMRALAAKGLPTTFLISRKGEVLALVEGAANWGEPSVVSFVERVASVG